MNLKTKDVFLTQKDFEQIMENQELSRCPFCGGVPDIYGYFDRQRGFYIYQITCSSGRDKCSGTVFAVNSDPEVARAEAKAMWENRYGG